MEGMSGVEIRSEKYGVRGMLVNKDGRDFLIQFTYEGDQIKLPFPVAMNEQTLPWLGTVGEMMIDRYIETAQSGKKLESLMDGGTAWQ